MAPFLDPRSKTTGVEAAKGLLISVVAITSWLQYYPIACVYHCYWASIPMYGVFAYLFYSLHSSPSRVAKSMVAVAVIGLVFYKDVTWRIDSWAPRQHSQNSTITSISTLRGMRTWEAERTSYDALALLIDAYHRVYPEGGIVTTTRHALFPALTLKQAYYHPLYVIWEDLMPKTFPEALPARAAYIKEKLPMVIGALDSPATHVRVASLWWGGPMEIYVPKNTHPTEFVTCEGSGPCRRSALQY
jgi:hypothetical protein